MNVVWLGLLDGDGTRSTTIQASPSACVAVCPEAAVRLSLGFERHPQERFRIKGPSGKIMQQNDPAIDPYTIDLR